VYRPVARVGSGIAAVVSFPFTVVAFVLVKIRWAAAFMANRLVADAQESLATFVEEARIPEWVVHYVRSLFVFNDDLLHSKVPKLLTRKLRRRLPKVLLLRTTRTKKKRRPPTTTTATATTAAATWVVALSPGPVPILIPR
jgi:hypothetical protein